MVGHTIDSDLVVEAHSNALLELVCRGQVIRCKRSHLDDEIDFVWHPAHHTRGIVISVELTLQIRCSHLNLLLSHDSDTNKL